MTKYDNSGSLGKNLRKEKDTHPDLRGKATVAGVEYWISGWRRVSDDGTWYSLAFEPKDTAQPVQPERTKERNGKADASRHTPSDEIPF